MSLDTIANISISIQPPSITLAGFGTPLIAAVLTSDEGTAWTAEFGSAVTTSVTAQNWRALMTTLGVTSTEQLYLSLLALFSQDEKPATVKIGRRATAVAQVSAVNIVAATDGTFTVTINGEAFTFLASSDTVGDIRDGLIADINAGAEPVTAAIVDADTLSVTADEAGVPFTISVTHSTTPASITTGTTTASVGLVNDIDDWETEDSDWYELLEGTRSSGVIKAAAADIESRTKIFQAQTDDANAQIAGSTDLGSVLGALAYDRTGLWWHDDDAEHVDSAISGRMLPEDPGSATWANTVIRGVPGIVPTGESFLAAKNYNWNENFAAAGFTMTRHGKMVSGQFIDLIIGRDWLQNLIQTRLVQALMDSPKIPYTDRGGQVIGAIIRACLVEAAQVGLVVEDSIVVTIPAVSSQSTNDRTDRHFPNVTFSATLQGAIHSLEVSGSLET